MHPAKNHFRIHLHLVVPAIATLLALILLASAQAQVPQQISYQGSLWDGSGPAQGPVEMHFELFLSESGNDLVFASVMNVDVQKGLFGVLLGPLDDSILQGGSLWLQISADGTPLTPRQRLVSSPFALRAGSVDDGVISSDKLATGAVVTDRIADGAVTSAKLADSAVTNAKLGVNAVSTANLQDLSVSSAKLANDAVTNAKLANNAVSNLNLQDGAVTTTKLSDGAVTNARLATGAVTGEKIAQSGAGDGQVLKWSAGDGQWVAADTPPVLFTGRVRDAGAGQTFGAVSGISAAEASVDAVQTILSRDCTATRLAVRLETKTTNALTVGFNIDGVSSLQTCTVLADAVECTSNDLVAIPAGVLLAFSINNSDAAAHQVMIGWECR